MQALFIILLWYKDLEAYVKMAKTKLSKLDERFYLKDKQEIQFQGLSLKTVFLKSELWSEKIHECDSE